MRRRIRIGGVVLVTLLAARAWAGDSHLSFVPWKVLEPGAEPLRTPFILFWMPTSADEMRHSDLITSQRLTLYAGRCIGMQVVRVDDGLMVLKLSGAKPPLAVLMEGEKELARVEPADGALTAAAVEAMVRETIDRRELARNSALDRAADKARGGENASAIDLYRQVAGDACLFPRLAKTAQRALRRLGVKP
ncbi:MAG TPA: hypothetical protein VLV78_12420 [Thermoanaerobaculia bacterium]|nr:hypothetical protein [Thermoanaerobaculia bacterium]